MTYLLIGVAALFLVLLGARVFASADPVLLAKVLRWSLVSAGVLLALYLFFRGQALLAAAPAAVAAVAAPRPEPPRQQAPDVVGLKMGQVSKWLFSGRLV